MNKIAFGFLCIILCSCSASQYAAQSLSREPASKGKVKTFQAPLKSIIQFAREAAIDAGLEIQDFYQEASGGWVLMAIKQENAFNHGAVAVRIMMKDLGNGSVEVRVLGKRGQIGELQKKDYSGSIFAGIQTRLMTGI